MPRVRIKNRAYKKADFCIFLAKKLYENGMSQKTLAEKLNITQQCLSAKMKCCRFTYEEVLIITDVLAFTDEEKIKILTLGARL